MISQKEIQDSEGRTALIYGVTEDESSLIARLDNNQLLSVPIQLLVRKDEKKYFLSVKFSDLEDATPSIRSIPVIEERPVLSKRTVETTRIKVKKEVTRYPQVIEQSLTREEVQIERLPINEVRDLPAQIRNEGDLTIIPIQEEILIVEKKILVREEIRIRKVKSERKEKIEMNLLKETVTIDRKKVN